ncbi:helix-turn-helix domain-containing protein [Candidatus Allofournierella excrementigallinarum]|uniref:helix-turn-helix domain-containing protein n=1 Tax=Candidatus Allofournierella excrementigallinarum TaxID=2838592 RepID=UPI00374E2A07
MSRQRSMEVIENSEYVTIGELVRLTNVRYSTLKYYTEEGMLPFEQAEENLTRRYKREQSVVQIQRIKDLRQEGKSILEIKTILKL